MQGPVLPDPAAGRTGAIEHEPRAEQRRVAGLAPGSAQLHLVDAASGLDEAVRRRGLRIEVIVVRVAVHARAVGAEPGSEQQALLQGEQLFLRVQSQVLHRLLGLRGADARRLAHALEPECERAADDVRFVEITLLVLEARRRGRLKGVRGGAVRVHDAAHEIQPQVGRLAEHHRAGLAVLRLELEIGGRQDVVPLAEEVQAARQGELQALGARGDGIHLCRGRAEDAPYVFGVPELRDRLQRVRRRERVRRIDAVHGLHVHEAGRL